MRPDVSRDLKTGWISIGVASLLAAIGFAIVSDGGTSATQLKKARATYESNKGDTSYRLLDQIDAQRQTNEALAENIAELKYAVGIKPIRPFALQSNFREQKGYYHRRLFDIAREYLGERARNMRISKYDNMLGFDFPEGKLVSEEQASEELIRLQLTVRAILLALSTPDRLQEISIEHGHIIETGPVSRPPLLREYPFTIKVKGSLKDILWLLHQYASDQVQDDTVDDWNKLVTYVQRNLKRNIEPTRREDHFPLILTGLNINSENSEPLDQIEQLEAEFELAGMQFLSPEEREAVKTRTRGGRVQRF